MSLLRRLAYRLATRKPLPGEYVDPQPVRVPR